MATGTVSVRRTPAIVNLDRPGAPAEQLCPALRRRLMVAERAAVTPAFAYEHGLFAHAAKRAGYVEIDRCKKPPIMIPGRGQPRDFDLGAGLLTWDTGYAAPGFDEEEESPYPSTITAYRLSNGERRGWRLPRLSVLRNQPPHAVLGYSSHTAHTAFWIAARAVLPGRPGGNAPERSSVYTAKF